MYMYTDFVLYCRLSLRNNCLGDSSFTVQEVGCFAMYLVNVYYIVINDSHAYMYVKINGVCIAIYTAAVFQECT